MNDKLDELAVEARRAYFKKWRSQNKEKVRRHNQNYWKRKAEQKFQEKKRGE